ncbi:DUF1127 domain-containing protein [Primorskyibacter sp. 2E233]|uniref:DUF1127 domain-containing protein n=1 Tax=Primorskyibacter sp. 2E233 TaxID=3413431 RepID=UPI003BF079DF
MIRVSHLALPRLPRSPLPLLRQWRALARQRRILAGLDESALRDVGLSRHEARTEAERPFWDAPDNWRI